MKYPITFLFILSLPCLLQAQTVELDKLVSTYAAQQKFNGSVLVAKGGQVLLTKGYGFRNAKDSLKNDAETIFQIGSITKQFTAEIILLLQQQGKLSVTDKLSKFYPGYPTGDSITLEHLMSHTSGIFNYTEDSKFMATEAVKPITEEKLLALFRDKPLKFVPGMEFSYSNSNYILLAFIIQKVTHLSYEQAVRKYIFEPLRMTRSGFDFAHITDRDKAVGYFNYYGTPKVPATIVDSSVSFGAGAIYTSTLDLYRWHQGLNRYAIVSRDLQERAYIPVKNKYGYGVGIDSLYGNRIIAHGGGIFGFSSQILRVPADDVCIVLLDNDNNPVLNDIAHSLLAILYQQPYEAPKEKIAIELPTDSLRQFQGKYQLGATFFITMTLEGKGLMAQATGQPAFPLFAMSPTRFFVKAVDAEVEFFRDEKGAIERLVLYQGGSTVAGKKITNNHE